MKHLSWLQAMVCAAAFVLTAASAPAQSDLIAQIHFLGGDKISADPNSHLFTNEFCSAEARALENQTFNKMAATPYRWFQNKLQAGAPNGAAQLRPLLDDLLKAEWVFEMRDSVEGAQEYALAIRLDANRAALWQKNLADVLQSWTKLATQKIQNGWQLRKHDAPNLIRTTYSDGWLIVGCGQNELQLPQRILKDITANWLDVSINFQRLGQAVPAFQKLDLPKTQFTVTAAEGNFRVNGKLLLAQPLPALEPWRVPTNSLHQPFMSFTAVRGITPWLEKQPWFQPYEISPMPQQYYFWALPGIPFQTFGAVPVQNGGAALQQLDSKLNARRANAGPNSFLTPFTLQLTNNQIFFQGFPFASPSIKATHEASGDFLVGGFFPNTPRSKPLPPELFTRLATPKLVFYHWEITAERLKELPQVAQLLLMLTRHQQLDGGSAGSKWINKIGPTLGNTVTEATETGPNEITFTRKAPGGLTAIEFFVLANWLEAPNFPGFDLRLPNRPNLRHPNPRVPMTPPPAALPR